MTKRVFDLVVSAVLGVLTAPLWLLSAVLVRLSSGRPVIFRQERIGRGGRPFTLLKLRTMRAAPAIGSAATDTSAGAPELTVGTDPRVTRVGRWLRAARLDELPQLVNVLRGDMSLVGPRPEVPRYVARQAEIYAPLLAYRPGLTDPATLAYAAEAELLAAQGDPEGYYVDVVLPHKVALSLDYARRAGVCSDIGVLARTVRVALSGVGARNAPADVLET